VTDRSVRLIVSGRVQGVGFRQFIARCATEAGGRGWVRNLADGRVEIVIAGSAEAVSDVRRAASEGPPSAMVTQVDDGGAEHTGALPDSFEILR
jgi:acylphosphatase